MSFPGEPNGQEGPKPFAQPPLPAQGESDVRGLLERSSREAADGNDPAEVPTEALVVPAPASCDCVDSGPVMRKPVFESMAARPIDVMVAAGELAFSQGGKTPVARAAGPIFEPARAS